MASVALLTIVGALCCLGVAYAQKSGAVRLVGGSMKSEGRLEIYKDNRWGTVTDDYWYYYGDANAQVVCNQLGYTDPDKSAYQEYAAYGPGTGRIHMDNVMCSGWESNLLDCSYRPPDAYDSHGEDVGVSCFCSSSPDCSIPEQECPFFRQEIVTVPHRVCPICRCASCPLRPKCPTNCKSGQTMYYEGEVCRRCKCRPQELPEFIEEPNDISLIMVLAAVIIMLVIPTLALIVVCCIKSKRNKAAAAKVKAAKKAQQEQEQQDNWFADPAQVIM